MKKAFHPSMEVAVTSDKRLNSDCFSELEDLNLAESTATSGSRSGYESDDHSDHSDNGDDIHVSRSRSASASSCSSGSSVGFSTIEVRQYSQVCGDNPSCSEGVPISIGWDYITFPSHQSIQVEDYEDQRLPRRKKSEMRLPSFERERILLEEWDVSFKTILQASEEVKKIQAKRTQTACQRDISCKAEEISERILKRIKTAVRGKEVPPHMKMYQKKKRSCVRSTSTAAKLKQAHSMQA